MTKKHINSYNKGMNKDLSIRLYNNKQYLDAEWLTPIINEETTVGSLTNPKGTVEKINLPANHTVIGHCKIRDVIIIITYENVTYNSTYIYKFIDDGTLVSQSPGSVNFIQIYTDSGLSSDEKLGYDENTELDVVGRYENEDIQKIYFASEGFPLRYFNFIDDLSGYTQYNFNIIPAVSLSKPEFESYTSGNKTSGRVCYSYQLYKAYANETSFSECSQLVSISTSIKNTNINKLYGSDIDVNTGVGIKISIDNLDTNFDRIRILSFDYFDIANNPTINIIYEGSFTSSSISVVDNGTSLGTYDLSTFRIFHNFLPMPKVLAQKSNILFAGNVTEKYFDIDRYLIDSGQTSIMTYDSTNDVYFWDSRVYRFRNPSGTIYADLQNSSGGTHNILYASSLDYTVVNYNADCVNIYNKVSNNAAFYGNSNGAKFKTDGVTLGGNGENLEFRFEIKSWNLDVDSSNYKRSGTIVDEHIGFNAGYQWDEVYRLYIQFENYLGQKSFPKWVLDCRMPNLLDGGAYSSMVTVNGSFTQPRYIYPEFRIRNTPQNPDGSYMKWRVLRVKREGLDKTIIGTGIASGTFDVFPDTDASSPFELIPVRNYNTNSYTHPGATPGTNPVNSTTLQIVSPELLFSDIDISNFEIHHMGYYDYYSSGQYYFRYVGDPAWKLYTTTTPDLHSSRFQISRKLRKLYNATYTDQNQRIKSLSDWIKVSPDKDVIDEFSAVSTVGSKSYRHISESDSLAFSYATTCIIANIPSSFGMTAANIITDGPNLGLMYVEIKNTGITYGGDSYEARLRNFSVPGSKFFSGTQFFGSWYSCRQGDVFFSYYEYLRNQVAPTRAGSGDDTYQEVVHIPLESRYNLNLRTNEDFNSIIDINFDINFLLREDGLVDTTTGIELSRLYQYNNVYSKDNDAEIYQPTPVDSVDTDLYDHRIRRSQVKFNGEYSDSWLKFLENDYLDVDSQYGEIVKLDIFNDRLLYFQNTGFGNVPVGEKELIPSDTSATLALGSSGILNRYDYLSDRVGIKYKGSITISPNAVYIFSSAYNTLYRFTGNTSPLSDVSGMNSWFDEFVNVNTIVNSTYNSLLNEIIFIFNNNKIVVFNELGNEFVYRYPTSFPGIYYTIESDNSLYSFSSSYNGYKHNVGDRNLIHTSWYDSSVTLVVNPGGTIINLYDVLELLTDHFANNGIELDSTFTTIQVTNDYQDSGVIPLIPNSSIVRRFRTWRFNKLRDSVALSPKIRSSFIKVKLTYTNRTNNQIVLNNLITNYRPSKMMY